MDAREKAAALDVRFYDSDGKRHEVQVPFLGCDFVIVDGACPHCEAEPFKAQGRGMSHDHDTYYAQARCLGCDKAVGQIELHVSTVFGIEEDERVLNGRCRVY